MRPADARWAAALLLLLALAAPAAGQDGPPPPASLDAKTVAAWAEQHLDARGWRVLAINPYGLFLASPDGVTVREDGLAEADLRHEMFAPTPMGDGAMRSDLERWLVDCPSQRHALLRISLYRGNNLQDEYASRGTETPKFRTHEPDDEASHAVAAICEAVTAGKRAKPAGHP